MDHARSNNNSNGEENVGIPDDLRCKRSDGKQWRCTAMSMPDKTVCEKHYIQAKKRAANSAMRANLKKAKRKYGGDSDVYLESKSDDFDAPISTALNNNNSNNNHRSGKKLFDQVSKNQFRYTPNSDARNGSSSNHAPKDGDDSPDRENGDEDVDLDVDVDVPLDEDNSGSDESEHGSGDEDSARKRSRGSLDANATTEYSDGTSDSSQDTGGQTCHQCRRNVRDRVTWCLKCDRRGYCDSCISTW